MFFEGPRVEGRDGPESFPPHDQAIDLGKERVEAMILTRGVDLPEPVESSVRTRDEAVETGRYENIKTGQGGHSCGCNAHAGMRARTSLDRRTPGSESKAATLIAPQGRRSSTICSCALQETKRTEIAVEASIMPRRTVSSCPSAKLTIDVLRWPRVTIRDRQEPEGSISRCRTH